MTREELERIKHLLGALKGVAKQVKTHNQERVSVDHQMDHIIRRSDALTALITEIALKED